MKVNVMHVFEQPKFQAAQQRLDRAMAMLESLRSERAAMLKEWRVPSTAVGGKDLESVLSGAPVVEMVEAKMTRMTELNVSIEILERAEPQLRRDVEHARFECQQLVLEQLKVEIKGIGSRFDAAVKQLAAVILEEYQFRDGLRLQGYGITGMTETRRRWLSVESFLEDEAHLKVFWR